LLFKLYVATHPSLFDILTTQKWEAKLLQSRVADFARAPEAGNDDDDDSDDNETSRAGPSSQPQNNATAPPHNPYGYSGAPATIQNGYNQNYQQTTQQYNSGLALPGMVNVKTEPDMPIRPRGGGSVSIFSECWLQVTDI
jgi:transcription initiation factor TFIIA large subunit